jgi:hypothetical protein
MVLALNSASFLHRPETARKASRSIASHRGIAVDLDVTGRTYS